MGRELWGVKSYIHYLDCGSCFIGMYICQSSSNCTLQIARNIIQLYFSKAVIKNKTDITYKIKYKNGEEFMVSCSLPSSVSNALRDPKQVSLYL